MPKPVDEQTMKERRGQFFTASANVQEAMASLLTHAPSSSRCLEPSAGAGDLVSTLERHGYADIDAIEFDPSIETICRTGIERGSFFRYARGKEAPYHLLAICQTAQQLSSSSTSITVAAHITTLLLTILITSVSNRIMIS